jgi:hypothetical protein
LFAAISEALNYDMIFSTTPTNWDFIFAAFKTPQAFATSIPAGSALGAVCRPVLEFSLT